ncbi:MAG: hypothetical protein SGJ19_01770 [Planctomycetia bacterium]|nr:hypothetical protein [Planctomycetia bacterium]
MPGLLSALYDAAPPLRPLMASLRGWQLRRERFGRETESLVQQALERDRWTATQWQDWQAERLSTVLEIAAQVTTPYRNWWVERNGLADGSWRDLRNWPVLEKESLRKEAALYLAAGVDPRKLTQIQTSGSTGTPLKLWHSRRTQRAWYALFEARCRRWYGVSGHDRWAILGGKIIKPVREARPPYWVWNAVMRQLYLSTYHLSPERVSCYLDALLKYQVKYLLGYPSALNELAIEALQRGRNDVHLKVVVTNAEPLSPQQRDVIGRAFGCPVRNTYGLSEYAAGASECEAGNMHLWPDAGILEVRDADGNIAPSGRGELVATSLLKQEMPLVRYSVGDFGRLASSTEGCDCGRTLPLLGEIEGRTDDIVITTTGARIGRLDPVFKVDIPIRESQIVQETLDRFLVRYVPAEGFRPEHEQQIAGYLREFVGPVQVRFESVARVPRTASGKLKSVVSLLP